MKLSILFASVCIAFAATSSKAADHYSFQLVPGPVDRPLIQLPVYLNNSGTMAGVWWVNDTKFQQTGQIVSGASIQPFTIPSSTSTVIGGLNESGTVSGRFNLANDTAYAFTFSGSGLQVLKGRSGTISTGYGINDAGTVVGADKFDAAGTQFRAVQWVNGQPMPLNINEGTGSLATNINNAGMISGVSYTDSGAYAPFVWDAGKTQFLPTMTANGAFPDSINASGEVTGWAYDDNNTAHAVAWVDGKLLSIGELAGGTTSFAFSVNDGGTVVGSSISGNLSSGVKFENGKLVDLNLLITPVNGLHITDAVDVNNHGQILVGAIKDNQQYIYLMTPQDSPPAVPLPPAVWMSLLTIPAVMWAMRKMQKRDHRPLR